MRWRCATPAVGAEGEVDGGTTRRGGLPLDLDPASVEGVTHRRGERLHRGADHRLAVVREVLDAFLDRRHRRLLAGQRPPQLVEVVDRRRRTDGGARGFEIEGGVERGVVHERQSLEIAFPATADGSERFRGSVSINLLTYSMAVRIVRSMFRLAPIEIVFAVIPLAILAYALIGNRPDPDRFATANDLVLDDASRDDVERALERTSRFRIGGACIGAAIGALIVAVTMGRRFSRPGSPPCCSAP